MYTHVGIKVAYKYNKATTKNKKTESTTIIKFTRSRFQHTEMRVHVKRMISNNTQDN